ncbi:MAG TPA: NAD-dependent epimerase/dehydratase family protein [Chthoniobacterales bacterium]|jgi:nucleoside-diphosphate-sugar epimerase
MKRVLIAGCGYVGKATADLFQAAGWEVEGWTRSPESAAHCSCERYRVRAVDIADRKPVEKAASEFGVVIHCASTRGGRAENYRRIYFEGARNLLEVLPAFRFIFCSSTSVYAQTSGEWVDEESATRPAHETGKILRETEEVVRRKGGIVARLAGIYGPGRSALLRKFLSGEARLENGGKRYLNQVHRDDIAAALFLLATLPNEMGIVNVCDNEPMTQRECYEWLATTLNRPLSLRAEATGERKRGASNKRVSNRKLCGLRWEPQFPSFGTGMKHSVLPDYPRLGA